MPEIPDQWNIFANRVFWVCFGVWFFAQFIKVILNSVKMRRVQWQYFLSPGSMPSAHCALVAALTTSVGIIEGFNTVIWAITGVLAIIVIYDAAGVRRTVGLQSTVLNRIVEELFRGKPIFKRQLREFIGHTNMEVLAGIALGVMFGAVGATLGT